MNIKRIILIIFLFLSIKVYAQVTHIVNFERAVRLPYSGQLITLQVTEDHSFLKNIPDIDCDIWAINSFKLNQYVKADSIPNQIYLFVGVNESKKEKYVVVDANNNYDFSDDRVFTFTLPDEPLSREDKAERAVGLKIAPIPNTDFTAHIGVDPFNYFSFKYSSTQDERLEVVIVFTEYMIAKTEIDDLPVELSADVVANNLFKKDLVEETNFRIWYKDKANNQINKSFSSAKDTFQLNDKIYKLIRIEHPNIYLQEIGILSDSSYVGSYFPVVFSREINDNYPVSINNLIKDKYVFIDFWGSWCGPCIQSIPELKGFYEKIKDRKDVLMMGIALEQTKKDVEKLKDIIEKQKMEWLNLWLLGKEPLITKSIFEKLNISSFPTYLIVDNKGKIVYKENSTKNTEIAMAYFMYLIGE